MEVHRTAAWKYNEDYNSNAAVLALLHSLVVSCAIVLEGSVFDSSVAHDA